MDQRRRASSLCVQPASSSFFFHEPRFPNERQVGFWKAEAVPEHSRSEGMPLMPEKRSTALPVTSWRGGSQGIGFQSDICAQPAPVAVDGNEVGATGTYYENSLFSSSLSELFDKRLKLSSKNVPAGQSVDNVNSSFGEDEPFESLGEIEAQTICDLLPDDEDLLSGVFYDLGYVVQPNVGDDTEDIFCSGGGLELEADDSFKCTKTADSIGEAAFSGQRGALNNQISGEHPYGEHPSRTLFVRNISSNVVDADLRALFKPYGDIRKLYTESKHRGFVMISYYDIRAARNALKALQNQPLGHRKLDIHYSIPKDNPSEKDINQGTLVVFNLDSSVSNDNIRQIFGVYGEIREIREAPKKRNHKFIEFYDARSAEAALRALNRSDIAGKKIKLEPSHPGGTRRCLIQHSSPQLELEESSGCRHGSPNNSPSGCCGSIPLTATTSNGLDNGVVQGRPFAAQIPANPYTDTAFHGISSDMLHSLSSPIWVANNHSNPSGHGELNNSSGQMKFGLQCIPSFLPQSLPEYHDVTQHVLPYISSTMSAMGINSIPSEGVVVNNHSFHNEYALGLSGGSCPLHAHQYIWNSAGTYDDNPPGSVMWPNSPAFVNTIPSQMHGLPRVPSHMPNTVFSLPHHHVGSEPAIYPSLWNRQQAYAGNSTDARAFNPASLGTRGLSGHSPMHQLEFASCNIFPCAGGNCIDSAHVGNPSPNSGFHMFHEMTPIFPTSFDSPNDRIRIRRSDSSANQADNKRKYELDIESIIRGEESRTTLMIKNIPNKYNSDMLLAAIDEHNKGTYDFLYLPIDFKNQCNVGYAFINMIIPQHIIPFYQAFNGQKWEKFNSEKVASLAYARIQGRTSLIAHFQNSSLMHEDKRCRPILFYSDGPNAGEREPFPTGANIRSRARRSRIAGYEESQCGSPATSSSEEGKINGTGYSSASNKSPE